jgi:hypothetical protein
MGFLSRLFASSAKGSSRTRSVTVNDPVIITAPSIGFVNLMGAEGEPLLAEDKAALSGLFAWAGESTDLPPVCNLLFVYVKVRTDAPTQIRQLIARSGALIAVIASPNEGKSYNANCGRKDNPPVNLVMTLDRKGTYFADFFHRLFTLMYQGKTMPVAWVQLAPQDPNLKLEGIPDTIFAAEISHILFEQAAAATQ